MSASGRSASMGSLPQAHPPQTPHINTPPAAAQARFDYNQGYRDGLQHGTRAGAREGRLEGFQQGRREAYHVGYNEGQAQGYAEGQRDGHATGHADGYAGGYADGHAGGYADGHADGRADGYAGGYDDGYLDGVHAGVHAEPTFTTTTDDGLVYGNAVHAYSGNAVLIYAGYDDVDVLVGPDSPPPPHYRTPVLASAPLVRVCSAPNLCVVGLGAAAISSQKTPSPALSAPAQLHYTEAEVVEVTEHGGATAVVKADAVCEVLAEEPAEEAKERAEEKKEKPEEVPEKLPEKFPEKKPEKKQWKKQWRKAKKKAEKKAEKKVEKKSEKKAEKESGEEALEEPTVELVEEAVQEPEEKPVVEPVEELVEELVEEQAVEEPEKQPQEEAVQEPEEQPEEELVEEAVQEPGKEPQEELVEEKAVEEEEEPVKEPPKPVLVDGPGDDQPVDRPVDPDESNDPDVDTPKPNTPPAAPPPPPTLPNVSALFIFHHPQGPYLVYPSILCYYAPPRPPEPGQPERSNYITEAYADFHKRPRHSGFSIYQLRAGQLSDCMASLRAAAADASPASAFPAIFPIIGDAASDKYGGGGVPDHVVFKYATDAYQLARCLRHGLTTCPICAITPSCNFLGPGEYIDGDCVYRPDGTRRPAPADLDDQDYAYPVGFGHPARANGGESSLSEIQHPDEADPRRSLRFDPLLDPEVLGRFPTPADRLQCAVEGDGPGTGNGLAGTFSCSACGGLTWLLTRRYLVLPAQAQAEEGGEEADVEPETKDEDDKKRKTNRKKRGKKGKAKEVKNKAKTKTNKTKEPAHDTTNEIYLGLSHPSHHASYNEAWAIPPSWAGGGIGGGTVFPEQPGTTRTLFVQVAAVPRGGDTHILASFFGPGSVYNCGAVFDPATAADHAGRLLRALPFEKLNANAPHIAAVAAALHRLWTRVVPAHRCAIDAVTRSNSDHARRKAYRFRAVLVTTSGYVVDLFCDHLKAKWQRHLKRYEAKEAGGTDGTDGTDGADGTDGPAATTKRSKDKARKKKKAKARRAKAERASKSRTEDEEEGEEGGEAEVEKEAEKDKEAEKEKEEEKDKEEEEDKEEEKEKDKEDEKEDEKEEEKEVEKEAEKEDEKEDDKEDEKADEMEDADPPADPPADANGSQTLSPPASPPPHDVQSPPPNDPDSALHLLSCLADSGPAITDIEQPGVGRFVYADQRDMKRLLPNGALVHLVSCYMELLRWHGVHVAFYHTPDAKNIAGARMLAEAVVTPARESTPP